MTRSLAARWRMVIRERIDPKDDAGMATSEYAVGILAAVTFAGVLLAVVKSGAVKSALSAIITTALSVV